MPRPQRPVHECRVRVRSYELDSFGHVNHAVYLNYLEHARFETLRASGFTLQTMQERGWGVYVVRAEVDYLAEARLGDELRVETWAESARRSSMVIGQRVVRDDGSEVARAAITAVWIGESGRPMALPDEVRVAFGLPPASEQAGSAPPG